MPGGLDPFSLSTGGGGLTGGSSEASGTAKSGNTFGDFGDFSVNFGSGSISTAKTNWWLIGGIAAVGLAAFYLMKKKK